MFHRCCGTDDDHHVVMRPSGWFDCANLYMFAYGSISPNRLVPAAFPFPYPLITSIHSFDMLAILFSIALARNQFTNFNVNRRLCLILFIASVTLAPLTHSLQIHVSPTVTARSLTQVTWTRELGIDPTSFGLVPKSLNADSGKFGALVSVLAGENTGTAQVVFPSAGQFMLFAVEETETANSQPTSTLASGGQVSSFEGGGVIDVPDTTTSSSITSSSSESSTTGSRTLQTHVSTKPRDTETSIQSGSQTSTLTTTSTMTTTSKLTTTSTNTEGTLATSSPPITTSSAPPETGSDTNPHPPETTETTMPTLGNTLTNTMQSSLPTTQSPTGSASPTSSSDSSRHSSDHSSSSCQENPNCFHRRDGIIIGCISGVFILVMMFLASLRYQRLGARRRLEEFRGRLFGVPPQPVRERSSLPLNLNRLFDRGNGRVSHSTASTGHSSWLVGRSTPGHLGAMSSSV
ncbi:hypothetical protein L218DRAFT_987093 [Marasmius fiardii PR-910]|nr:hypothetical protein L218DRAFT_987093 [Marasmius fiardii PR-910]